MGHKFHRQTFEGELLPKVICFFCSGHFRFPTTLKSFYISSDTFTRPHTPSNIRPSLSYACMCTIPKLLTCNYTYCHTYFSKQVKLPSALSHTVIIHSVLPISILSNLINNSILITTIINISITEAHLNW